MNRLRVAALASACLALVVGCGASFQEFNSKDGHFKVSMPGKPKEQSQPAAGTTMHTFTVDERNGAYVVGYGDMPIPEKEPAEKIKDRLDGAMMGMGGNTGGKVVTQKDITVNSKYPGREFKLAITQPKKGEIRGKIFLQGKRLYQVFVVGTDAFANSANATKFLDSFTLTD
jgi:hypothetical protein